MGCTRGNAELILPSSMLVNSHFHTAPVVASWSTERTSIQCGACTNIRISSVCDRDQRTPKY